MNYYALQRALRVAGAERPHPHRRAQNDLSGVFPVTDKLNLEGAKRARIYPANQGKLGHSDQAFSG
jgi:hypothetical protein